MPWLTTSLNSKFMAGTAAGLLISLLVFLMLFVNLYSRKLEEARASAAVQVNRLLQTSLENAMLKRDLEGLRLIVERLGTQPEVASVMITSPQGEVRFASDPTLLGRRMATLAQIGIDPRAEFLRSDSGTEVLRSINPVRNKPVCLECHGPIDQNPVNGILYVDYDAAAVRRQAWLTTLLLMGAGALIVLINLAGGWWFIRRFVLRPLAVLSAASQRLSEGDLGARAHLEGGDELARLGRTFNRMAESLQSKLRELEEKEQFLQRLVDTIPDGIRVINEDYQVVLANRAYLQQLGLPPATGPLHPCYQAHGRDEPCPATLIRCPLEEVRRSGEPLKVVHRHSRADGGALDVEVYAAPLHITQGGIPRRLLVESIRDLEQQVKFTHEQKLSELGRLAAGVAHEIHNPLTSIQLALHATQKACAKPQLNTSETSEIDYYLGTVEHEIRKCLEVTERLLLLSTPPPALPELVEIEATVGETLKLLHWEAKEQSVEIRFLQESPPLRVIASDSEMRQLSLNLAQNALHAMSGGGTLEVSARRADSFVEVGFRDSGRGIAEQDLRHIYEPFFSRRADGVRGTGLGLSICRAIVEGYGGAISVESVPGEGSLFTIRLPDADASAEGNP